MASIEGLARLQAYLKKRKDTSQQEDDVSGVVGYTAAYAVFVHENLEALHGGQFNAFYAEQISKGSVSSRGQNQQAKFLEEPARRMMNSGIFKKILEDSKSKGQSLKQGILRCALALQRESMMLVPVDSGNLRGSCFAKVEQKGK